LAALFFSHLECSLPCSAGPVDPRQQRQRCACGAPLLARYDLTAARHLPRPALAGREASMWRYRELLPLLRSARGIDGPVTLGEGWTPLVRTRRLGAELGLRRLYVKDESRNPTASVRARGLSAAVTRALHGGAHGLTVAGPGQTAAASAAYGGRAALPVHVFPAAEARTVHARSATWYGATVAEPDGSMADALRAAARKAADTGWVDVSALAEPYRLEGEKTLGYELAEQLDWEMPDWVVCPVGSGTTAAALAKALIEMAAVGWIDPVRRPHIVAVQGAGCAPVVRAFAANADAITPSTSSRTFADDLRVADPAGGRLVLRAIRDSGGTALAVGDGEILEQMRALATREGISASPGGGAALQAVRVLANEGRIKPHDTVVVINPGSAEPYLDIL
jgi:threonine synthase